MHVHNQSLRPFRLAVTPQRGKTLPQAIKIRHDYMKTKSYRRCDKKYLQHLWRILVYRVSQKIPKLLK